MTVFSGPFMAATVTEGAVLSINSRTTDSSAHIEAMAPPPGTRCIKVPRAATSRTASSSDMTSAAQAAAISPTLCPMSALGVMPQDFNSSTSAYSTANNAGCVKSVRLTSASSVRSAKMTSSKPLSRWGVGQFMAAIHCVAKNRVRSIQLRAHSGMLRPLAGIHERDRPVAGSLQVRRIPTRRLEPGREMLLQLCYGTGRCGKTIRKLASADVGREANVTDRSVGIVVQPVQQLLHPPHQCFSGFG